jgi:quercetin dioxygenase-like cupin family protein
VNVQKFAALLVLSFSIASIGSIAILAQGQSAPDASTAKVEFENEQIRVVRASLGPHQKTPVHGHPSRLGVTLTRNDIRTSLPDGTSRSSTRGVHEYFWSEPVTHEVENLSDAPLENIEIELKRASSAGVEVKPAAGESKAQGTATNPVAVEQEPHHHVIFENQYVRVLDVVLHPGETSLFHRHSLDNVAIQLSDATMKRQSPGEDWAASPAKEGSVGFIGGTKSPYIHRISNAGTTVFHVLDVEILP